MPHMSSITSSITLSIRQSEELRAAWESYLLSNNRSTEATIAVRGGEEVIADVRRTLMLRGPSPQGAECQITFYYAFQRWQKHIVTVPFAQEGVRWDQRDTWGEYKT